MTRPVVPGGRAARLAFIKAHHPDRGGDPTQFAAGLARLDRATPTPTNDRVQVIGYCRRGLVRRIADAVRRRVRPESHPARVR